MELRHKLERIFDNDYPGTERFISDVIERIFGDEIEYIDDDLIERYNYAEKAKKAGIKHINYVGDLTEKNYNADNIALLDVTLDDSKNIERSRVNIQQLIRSIMDRHQHLMIVFHYEDIKDKQWRFSYAYKGDSLRDTTSAKRYTYVFGKGYRGRTAAERFEILAKSQRNNKDFETAFSVEALSDEFFDKYRAYYAAFVEFITGEKYTDEKSLLKYLNSKEWLQWKQIDSSNQFETTFGSDGKSVRDYIKKMFGRIVFLYFLQRKGWLYDDDGNADARYMRHLFDEAGDLKNTFLDDVLELLFFYVLNTKPEQRIQEASLAHKDITILPGWEKIPFLNGGLFNQDEYDPKRCVFPAAYFDELFSFLDSYNFTIDENDQEDAEIGIDPEMLGRIFENLLEDNKDKGAFYTPKEIVDYMCRESIIAYLQNEPKNYTPEKAREFIETFNIDILSENERAEIERRLIKVKICDPAIGSGAFPMGLVNLLSKIFIVLRTYSNIDQARMKRYIMEQSIYGVDIEQGAVDIARLRFWLAMVVDEDEERPLPNLHFKIMRGNSLLESYKGKDLSKLTEVNIGKPGDLGLQSEEAKLLISSLCRFYNESDHEERRRIFNDIIHNVRRQIHDLTQSEEFMTDVRDLSANDKFFLWHTWFADVFAQGGFDIVIGNPPYLKERDNKHIFEPVNNSPFGKLYHTGKMDYWFYFMHKAFDICKPNACVSFITSRYWINSAGAKKLIERIKNIATVQSIVDIGSLKVFDNVVGHHMITQLRVSKHNSNCKYYLIEDDIKNIIANDFAIRREIPQEELITKNYEISVTEVSKAHGSGKELCDFCDVSQGVVEASDRISSRMLSKNNLPGFNVGDGIFVLSEEEKAKLNLSVEELSVLGEYLSDGCLSRYCIKKSNRHIIYADKTVRENIATMPEFSRLKAHLDRMNPFITSSNKPYGLHRPRNKAAFTSKKIIGPSMFKTPSFAIDNNGIFAGMSYNIVVPFKGEDIEWILAVLNSKYAEYWFNNNAKHRGIGNDVGVEKLRSFPMPAEAPRYLNQLKRLVLLRMDGKQELRELETKIDHIVYHLYNLTYDEVLIVDPGTPITREQYDNFNLQ